MEIVISELYLTGTYRASGLICRAWSLDTQSRVKPNFQTELRWAITVLQMGPGLHSFGLNGYAYIKQTRTRIDPTNSTESPKEDEQQKREVHRRPPRLQGHLFRQG